VCELLKRYANPEYASIAGAYLRLMAGSETLLKGWLKLDYIKQLKELALNSNFKI
jgi:hypothetical protein